jgi:membrane protein DedA with SNARE-associated domain
MKPLLFAAALFCGKFLRFLLFAIVTVVYGPAILHTVTRELHRHFGLVLAAVAAIAVLLVVIVSRKVFDRRRGTTLPVEED